MNRKYGIGAVTTGSNQWAPRQSTPWQRERRDGPLLPMLPEPRADHGRPGGLLAYGLSQLRRLSGAASLTRRTG